MVTALCTCGPADETSAAASRADAASANGAESWIAVGRSLAWEMAWATSDIYFHQADYTGTFYSLVGAFVADPHDPDAYICAGVMLHSMDLEADSLKMRLIGLDHTRDLFDAWHDLGFWYFDRQDFVTARDYFEEAAKRPCPPYVWKMWAHACEHNGELPKALEIWEAVRGIAPDDPVIDLNVNRIKKVLAERTESPGG